MSRIEDIEFTKFYFGPQSPNIIIKAMAGSQDVGYATFWIGKDDGLPFCLTVCIHPEFRGIGIATRMYDLAESYFGIPLVPSQNMTPARAKYWREKGRDVKEEHINRTGSSERECDEQWLISD